MTNNTSLTVIDINPGIGGRSLVFSNIGCKVLAAFEAERTLNKIFNEINPNIEYLPLLSLFEGIDYLPKIDIISANLNYTPAIFRNEYIVADFYNNLNELIFRTAPQALIFQVSTTLIRKLHFDFLYTDNLRRYSFHYQTFKESEYSGFSASGTQTYIVGIRNDILMENFYFPSPDYHSSYTLKLEVETSTIDDWYRKLPYKLNVNIPVKPNTLYCKNRYGELFESSRISTSGFLENYFCDFEGLRKLTHNEYAQLKGYDTCKYNFNQCSNKYQTYRLISSATNIYIFEKIAKALIDVLAHQSNSVTLEDWALSTSPSTATSSANRKASASKKKQPKNETLITPRNKLLNIHVERLKGLQNLDLNISKNMTAIMGVNCSGKSTVLHALACVFQPFDIGENYKFNFFFTPNPDALWNGSNLNISYLDENTQTETTRIYQKKSNRWSPKYSTRPKREVFFIGIDSCLPEIEKERQTSYISYSTNTAEDKQSQRIVEELSNIMGKNYREITNNRTKKKTMIGVCTSQDLRYSALSMGAGEQRVLKILQTIHNAPAFSLILIDEIDLLLHVKALERLVRTLSKLAEHKKLQIIFTTHSLAMQNLIDCIDIRYLYQTKEKTMVFDAITPDIVYDLANRSERSLTVYVEDDLTEAVIKNVINQLQITRHVSVKTIGSSENAFTLAAGLVLQNDPHLHNKLIVLDGDVYTSQEDKERQLSKKLSGTETDHQAKINLALSIITQLNVPQNTPPEKYLHNMITENAILSNATNEILYCANQITAANDSHEWIDGIVERMDQDRKITLFQVMNTAEMHKDWPNYINNVYQWLSTKKQELGLSECNNI